MEIFTNLVEGILEKPDLVLGEKSITKMSFYLYGFQMGARVDPTDDPLYNGFRNWVVERYQLGIQHNWASVILFLEGGCEYRAFDRLKTLWYEYKNKVIPGNLSELDSEA